MSETRFTDDRGNTKTDEVVKFLGKILGGSIVFLLCIVIAWSFIGPQLRLYRVNTEKQAIITEARAQADAAKYTAERNVEIAEAEAEVDIARAEGIAQAQILIAESLTPEYIQWYWVDTADSRVGDTIYVPSSDLVPFTEAGRAVEETPAK